MSRHRRGFSLVLVLTLSSALLLIAVAFTESVLSALRSTRLAWQGERAMHAADVALLQSIETWRSGDALSLRVGESDSVAGPSALQLTSGVVRTRTRARGFTLEGWATTHDGALRPSHRRIWRAVQLGWPAVPVHAALTSLGALVLQGGATVIGADATPSGWSDECSSDFRSTLARAVVANYVLADSTVTTVGDGAPITLFTVGQRTLTDSMAAAAMALLAARATRVTTDSVLDLSELDAGTPACPRWFGDARRTPAVSDACSRRWPIVLAAHGGETRLRGHAPAQGVLLVRGDLRIDPEVQFAGVVLIDGTLHIDVAPPDLPPTIIGGVLLRDQRALGALVRGPALIQSSQCAIRLALAAAGAPQPVQQHGWTERP